MKYCETVPENFLLLRFVATRFCNYRCPYCYVPEGKIGSRKSMFSHHPPSEWIRALDRFGDRHLELYFTGGEPTLVEEFPDFLAEMVRKDFVKGVRIDSNLSQTEKFTAKVRDPKVRFLASFHPTRVSMEAFLPRVERLRELDMMGMVNVVASRENVAILGMAPHELADLFENKGCFLNVAKDFHRGLRTGYDPAYREYVDGLQHPGDNAFMNGTGLTTGRPCGPGKHYLSLSRHGRAYSCGGVCHGGLFDGTLDQPAGLLPCRESKCPSIISYSFSSANDFSPVRHLDDYVRRNRDHRAGLDRGRLARLWRRIVAEDLMPKEPADSGTGKTEGRISRYAKAIRRALPGS